MKTSEDTADIARKLARARRLVRTLTAQLETAVEPGTKVCTDPDHEGRNPLPRGEFYKHATRADGLQDRCKDCARRERIRHYYDNPAAERERSRQYRTAHPEKMQEYQRRQRAARKAKRAAAETEG